MKANMPPDSVIADLIRFGFRESDIAARFNVDPVYVTLAKKRLGLPLIPNHHPQRWRRNGARMPYRVRDLTPYMEWKDGKPRHRWLA